MKEVKRPWKPLFYYYGLALVVLLLIKPKGFFGHEM